MTVSARLFNCARCHVQVMICRGCDRGHIYCAAGCADLARTESLRRAGNRYLTTFAGRANNAQRQHRFRQRQAQKGPSAQKVTHHGSLPLAVIALLLITLIAVPDHLQSDHDGRQPILTCSFCAGVCDAFVRMGFLRPPMRHSRQGSRWSR